MISFSLTMRFLKWSAVESAKQKSKMFWQIQNNPKWFGQAGQFIS